MMLYSVGAEEEDEIGVKIFLLACRKLGHLSLQS
jgi:hypothetical protein